MSSKKYIKLKSEPYTLHKISKLLTNFVMCLNTDDILNAFMTFNEYLHSYKYCSNTLSSSLNIVTTQNKIYGSLTMYMIYSAASSWEPPQRGGYGRELSIYFHPHTLLMHSPFLSFLYLSSHLLKHSSIYLRNTVMAPKIW